MKTYWFTRPGYFSTEAARIALALIYIYCNSWRYDPVSAESLYTGSVNLSAYDPKSIVALFFPAQPPGTLALDIVLWIAKISPVFLLLGLFSKTALWTVFLSNLFLRALIESFGADWSHGFNVILLCHLAFLFAPVGQFWSMDAWIRKKRGTPVLYRNGWWSVLLAQWAAALMFFSAFYHKVLLAPHALSLPWVFTDNLRNQTLYRYESLGEEVPACIGPFIHHPFLYKSMALLNILFQCMVILSLFFVHKPRLRLIFGLCFLLEEAGLSFFFQLHDWQWFPLIVFFIDWDYFFPRAVPLPAAVHPTRPYRRKYAFIFSFLCFYFLCTTRLLHTVTGYSVFGLKAYPFSEFAMYSGLLANRPDNPSVIYECHYEVNGHNYLSAVCRKIKRSHYGNYNVKDLPSLSSIASDLVKKTERGTFSPLKEHVKHFGILNSVSTFSRAPQKAQLIRAFTGYSLLRRNNTDYYAGLRQNTGNRAQIYFAGFSNPRVQLSYVDHLLKEKNIETGPDYAFEIPAEAHYAYRVRVTDTAFAAPVDFLLLR